MGLLFLCNVPQAKVTVERKAQPQFCICVQMLKYVLSWLDSYFQRWSSHTAVIWSTQLTHKHSQILTLSELSKGTVLNGSFDAFQFLLSVSLSCSITHWLHFRPLFNLLILFFSVIGICWLLPHLYTLSLSLRCVFLLTHSLHPVTPVDNGLTVAAKTGHQCLS